MEHIENYQAIFEKIFKEHLKIETYSMSIESLFSPRLKDRIDYKPYYQRNYVWDKNKATYFIESILLGTEVPPLIFFDNNSKKEVIDGRQRFESILRFMDNKFTLSAKGLTVLKQLRKCGFDDLAKTDHAIIDSFLDAKLRIIEFRLVNEPPLDKSLEDRVKKEIFSRYNSGITPLRKAEIDSAVYDNDTLSNVLKKRLTTNTELKRKIHSLFFIPKAIDATIDIADIMSFIRRILVLPQFPISIFAQGRSRPDILNKLYEKYSDDAIDNENHIVDEFIKKIYFMEQIKAHSIKNRLSNNRFAMACFLWGLGVLEQEEIKYDLSNNLAQEIADYINEHIEDFAEEDSAFQKKVMTRYTSTIRFLQNRFKENLDFYINASDVARSLIKNVRTPDDTKTKLSELETLRLNRPEPSRFSIEDLIRRMQRRKFLVRPSYQRKEVVNPSKSSSIIESVLLGITLPSIFVFKRKDGISEVIDGQQRILTLLGYIGAEYVDENNTSCVSKNHKFPLRSLRIIKELDKKKFAELDQSQKDRIFEFPLYIVEIDATMNPKFDPIDLFIRLNDKPYPIREHSFEMWNSWVDNDIIEAIKKLTIEVKSWFFVKQLGGPNDRDRMENEELLISLAFLDHVKSQDKNRKALDIYQKTNRINARLSDKAYVSTVLQQATESHGEEKELFLESIKRVKYFIKILKIIVLNCSKTKEELPNYLRHELDRIFSAGKESRYFKRSKQDMYMAWDLLSGLTLEMVKFRREEIRKRVQDIYRYMKNIPASAQEGNAGQKEFKSLCDQFRNDYRLDPRKICVSEEMKFNMIASQGGLSPLSGAPIYMGDDLEVDHDIPIAIGGKDALENLRIVHKDENRSKGPKSK